MSSVTFIDTSVLCNLVPVPGFDQDRDEVLASMADRLERREQFILPITSVIETGNHIAHLPDGRVRRETAEKLSSILTLICEGKTPWVLHDVAWNHEFLADMLDGADTMMSYAEHAANKLGAGDLCIINERKQYQKRSQIRAVIWTLDDGLSAYA